jgi:cytochrome b subunit of formate dehydrogenase
MASINLGRVVAGGLVAGVVANAIDFVTNTYVLAADWAAFAPTRNLDPAAFNSGSVAAAWITIDFLFGLLLVWTYAAMRPRFGAGPKTAILAGLALYLTVTVILFGFTQMGLMSMALFVKGSLCAVVSTLAASVAGAAVYKEGVGATGPAYAR